MTWDATWVRKAGIRLGNVGRGLCIRRGGKKGVLEGLCDINVSCCDCEI